MPVYNCEEYIESAIQSVLNQTFSDFELIIIEDHSTDSTLSIVKSFSDKRIQVITHRKNMGIIRSLNEGILVAKGQYIARMDGDDICIPTRFEKEIEYFRKYPSISLVSTSALLINRYGESCGHWDEDLKYKSEGDLLNNLVKTNCIVHPTILVKKEIIQRYRYLPNTEGYEDYILWLRMVSNREVFIKIYEDLLMYRIHPHSTTVSTNRGNIYLKEIYAKSAFLIFQTKKLEINRVYIGVTLNLVKNLIDLIMTTTYHMMMEAWIYVLAKLGRILSHISPLKLEKTVYLFPFYHIGGAEQVHLDILKTVKNESNTVIFTNHSRNKALLSEFSKYADVLDLSVYSSNPLFYGFFVGFIAGSINKYSSLVFGSNSAIYYRILNQVRPDIRKGDLIHAFGGGVEDASIKAIPLLNYRVTISDRTRQDLIDQYANLGLSSYSKRIEIIRNFVKIKPADNPNLVKDGELLKLLYVGRAGFEKRIHLVGMIAKECHQARLLDKIQIIGGLEGSMPDKYKQYCEFLPEISDKSVLEKHYKKNDILLLTSEREGVPMVIMEAMANGLVVVSTDVGGVSEVIDNNKSGYIVKSENEDGIVSAFVEIIKDLSKHRRKMSRIKQTAYNYAKTNFSQETFEKSYRQLLMLN